MSTIRKFIALVMLLALFLILFTVASANTTMNTEMTTITPNIIHMNMALLQSTCMCLFITVIRHIFQ